MSYYHMTPMGPMEMNPSEIHKKRVEKAGNWPFIILLFCAIIYLIG